MEAKHVISILALSQPTVQEAAPVAEFELNADEHHHILEYLPGCGDIFWHCPPPLLSPGVTRLLPLRKLDAVTGLKHRRLRVAPSRRPRLWFLSQFAQGVQQHACNCKGRAGQGRAGQGRSTRRLNPGRGLGLGSGVGLQGGWLVGDEGGGGLPTYLRLEGWAVGELGIGLTCACLN